MMHYTCILNDFIIFVRPPYYWAERVFLGVIIPIDNSFPVQVLPEAIQSKLPCPRKSAMCREQGLNPGPSDPESISLPVMLWATDAM